MARWVCNNCGNHFEGGIFNTRECPRCTNFISGAIKAFLAAGKLALFLLPVLLIIKILYNSLFENIAQSVKNAASLDTAVYYSPSMYFNNLIFIKSDSYCRLKTNKFIYRRMLSFELINKVAPYMALGRDQVILMKGITRKNDKMWIAGEFYKDDVRQRVFMLMPKDWESELETVDIQNVLDEAKNAYRKAVMSQVGYKEVNGKDKIKKFSEENAEYFRLDIEDISLLKPLMTLLSPQYEVAYYVKNTDRAKVEELKKQYLDMTVLEKRILEYKSAF